MAGRDQPAGASDAAPDVPWPRSADGDAGRAAAIVGDADLRRRVALAYRVTSMRCTRGRPPGPMTAAPPKYDRRLRPG